ncbi:ATP-binding protein [Streptomyces sp. B6B3]|uniref:ATP-binding protein n=1 Tax=Streptomyces sp. B6B3 TaxID=3153570 RepID=UPI00325F7697
MTLVAGIRRFRASFPASPMEVARVRRLIAAHLRSCGLDEVVDGVVLATDELLANAVQHGSTSQDDTVTVSVDCETQRLRIAVSDSSPSLPFIPSQREAGSLDEGGRGLAIVDQLCDGWGAEATPDGAGKQVWCTVHVNDAS